jgi:signal peptidase I
MAETPPTPDTSSLPEASRPPEPAADPIRTDVNGASPHVKTAEQPPRPQPTLKEWAVYRLLQAGALALLWVVLFFVLCYFGFNEFNAAILGVILAGVGSFFLRPMLPIVSPAEKYKTATATSPEQARQDHPPREVDPVREIIETVVFVIVLVLMLKTFVAEAFVIPTGSMAETLYGYQKLVTCKKCKYVFPVNCSYEVDGEQRGYVNGCTCPNCRQQLRLVPPVNGYMNVRIEPAKLAPDGVTVDPEKLDKDEVLDGAIPWFGAPRLGWHSGDRVLVSKFVYDLPGRAPERMDVVVFKFPGDATFPRDSGPIKNHSPMNYIKRLIGKPGETIAIHRGKIYVLSAEKAKEFGLTYNDYDEAKNDPNKLAQLWKPEFFHHNQKEALDLFEQKDSPFEIFRKPAAQVAAMMRLVYDYDHQPEDLVGLAKTRWQPADDSDWSKADEKSFKHDGGKDKTWLRYHHLLRPNGEKPSLIMDFMGYNSWEPHGLPEENWVSDLIVECKVDVKQASGEFVLELSKGEYRFQASFDLASGECTLYRVSKDDKREELGKKETKLKGTGTHQVRFANVDDRLLVWVDGKLPFGEGVEYKGVRRVIPTPENDLARPVSIGTNANVVVSQLRVFRDTYYTTARNGNPAKADVSRLERGDNGEETAHFDPTLPATFKNWDQAPTSTYYVQPDHFLCMGDNSPESSDGRRWGLVPRRLLLGRALLVYYPFQRGGRIR